MTSNNKGGAQTPYTLEERKKIEALLKQNKTGGEIAKILKRSKTGINFEVRSHGGKNNYCAITAQKAAEKAQVARIEKLKIRQSVQKFNPWIALKDRVECLEMQVNILKDTIKELLPNVKENK